MSEVIMDISDIGVGDLIEYNGEKYVCVETHPTQDQWYTIIYTIKESDYEKYKGKTLPINDSSIFKMLEYQDICDDAILEYRYHMVEKRKYSNIKSMIKLGE
jgi:hypothetical protein